MIRVRLDAPVDLDGFRRSARSLVCEGHPPEAVVFATDDAQSDLFASSYEPRNAASRAVRAPRRFIELMRKVACHRNPRRYAILYRILWRLQREAGLMDNKADDDVYQARMMAKAVSRDMHKMKAFVRFRKVCADGGDRYIAWFEPEHHIVEATAPFFAKRFTGMCWSIVTPSRSVHWNGKRLAFAPGQARDSCPDGDALEALWRTYYASIFNPARLKVDAMRAEMPKKYWRNLPEASLIPDLVRDGHRAQLAAPAGTPVNAAKAAEWNAVSAARFDEKPRTLADLNERVSTCERCTIAACGGRAVTGEGPAEARVVIVGEQPGDHEERRGRPFVGPAGHLLDRALSDAGLDRQSIYLTNAVKHFKFRRDGKIRLHATPNTREIEHCRWWLNIELELVRPRIVVALGASAVRSLTGDRLAVSEHRGLRPARSNTPAMVITRHPAHILRSGDDERPVLYEELVADLALAR